MRQIPTCASGLISDDVEVPPLVSDSAPADSQPIPDFHADTNSTDFAVADPRHLIAIPDLFDVQVILVGKLAAVVEVANVIMPGEAFLRPPGRDAWPTIFARVHPSRV